MSEVNVQIQNPQQTVNINNPSIVIEVAEQSIEVEFSEQNIEIQVQNPVIEVNIGGPCDCGDGGGGHEIQDEGTPLTQRGALNFVGAGVTVTDDSANNRTVVTIPGGGGGGTWGGITGTLSDQTDLQTALDGKVDENAAIVAATKTKITYDTKGLVTAGADAGIADITGLQTALDGKAASSHTHTYADITSGTIPHGTIAKVAAAGDFKFSYNNDGTAFMMEDSGGITFVSEDGNTEVQINANGLGIETAAGSGDAGQVWTADGLGFGSWQDVPGGPGGASYTEITYADMATAIAGGTLTPGGWYLITDAAGTDLGFLTYAVTENQISVAGVGGYLNADFQAVGDYTGVEAITGIAAGTQLGIWRTSFEAITINYVNLQFPADYVSYSTSSGLLDPAETFTTDLGTTGEVITDDGAGTVTVQNLSQALVAGEVITGDNSGNTVTVDSYTVTAKVFAVGDTITGGNTGAEATVVNDDGAGAVIAYMTSAGIAFDGSEVLDNGNGVTADMTGIELPPTLALGDIVIWNLLHWQLTDDTVLNGTDPATNTAAYTQLLKTDADQGYVTAWDTSEFDFAGNEIGYRQDLRGNLVRGNAGVVGFQWGRDDCSGNNIQSPDTFDTKNLLAAFNNNTTYPGADVSDIVTGVDTLIENNILENGASLTGITAGANCSISRNKIGQGATLGGSTTMGDGSRVNDNGFNSNSYAVSLNIGVDAEISANTLFNQAGITGVTVGVESNMNSNILYNRATIEACVVGDNAEVRQNTISSGGYTYGLTAQDGSAFFDNNIVGDFGDKTISAGGTVNKSTFAVDITDTETISDDIGNKRAEPGYSDMPGTIDITGLTALDCTAAFAQYRGIYNLTSSNATEAIDQITNPPTLFPFTLRPSPGLVLTITGTAYSGIAAGQIALKATDYTLDGDKGEYIVLEIDPLGTGALIEKQVVNGLI